PPGQLLTAIGIVCEGSIDPRTTAGAGHHTEPFLTPSPIARRLDSDLPGIGESRRFSTCSVLAAWRGSCFSNGATISPSVIDDSAIDSPTGKRRDPSDASQGHSSRPPGGPCTHGR
ncbi:hypothetical protein D917_01780, partial [Trichinella nativa]